MKKARIHFITAYLLVIGFCLTGCGKSTGAKSNKEDARYAYRLEECSVEAMDGYAFGFSYKDNNLYAGLLSVESKTDTKEYNSMEQNLLEQSSLESGAMGQGSMELDSINSAFLKKWITCYDTDTGKAKKIELDIPKDAMVLQMAAGENLGSQDSTFWASVYQTNERGISAFAINQYNEKGELITENDISEVVAEDIGNIGGNSYPNCAQMDSKGNLYLSFSLVRSAGMSSMIEGFSPEGRSLFRTEVEGIVNGMVLSDDGRLFAASWNREEINGEETTEILEINISLGECKSLIKKLPPNVSRTILSVGMDGDRLYYNADGDFYEYSFESSKSTKMFSMMQLGLSEEELVGMVQMDKSIFYVLGNTKDEHGKECSEWFCIRKVRLADGETVSDKKVLTLAMFADDSHVRQTVNLFNKKSTDYRIEIQVYDGLGQEGGRNRLQADIASGKTPDLIDLAGVDAVVYIKQGIVTDLTPFLEKETEVSKGDFLENAIATYQDGEALYAIPSIFWLSSMVGKSSVLDGRTGWNLEEYQNFIDDLPNPEAVTAGISKEEMFNRIILQYADCYIDWEAGNCSFDSEEFLALLAFADRFSDNVADSGMEEKIEKLRSEELLLYPAVMNSTMSYLQNRAIFNDEITYIGFPSENGSGTKIMVFGNAFGISEKCENKDAAWEFLKLLYMSEDGIMDGFPVYKTSLEKAFEAASVEWYHMDENGVRIEDPMAKIPYQNMTLEIYSATGEDIKKLRSLIENAEPADLRTPGIYEILQEEAAVFFSGQKTAKEAAAVMQNRVSLYIKENK